MSLFRTRDILFSGIALLFLSVPLAILALWLRVRYGQAFFAQQRPGLSEKPFTLYKFSKYYERGPKQGNMHTLGKWIQRSSIDELPQLWNVLRGDMSLVGPRPLLMSYLPHYTEEQRKRHEVLPGITGWAQIHGRSDISFEERFAYDLWYVAHKSFSLDAKIIRLTVWGLLSGRPASYHTERWK